ncbi:MAG: shikimate dehydrogenase [Pseudomonadota bacterium]
MATGPVQHLAVFGQPIAHSLSPAIHAQLAAPLDCPIDYQAIECGPGQLKQQLDALQHAGGVGCNVTVPLKLEAIDCADTVHASAQRAGAANTLVWDGRWHAHNTDGKGVVRDWCRQGIEVNHRSVLIIGAGGAVAGILPSLVDQSPCRIDLINRTQARAQQLVDQWADRYPLQAIGSSEVRSSYDVVIQATSLGHQGRLPDLDSAWFGPDSWMYDLNYGPAHAGLRQWCIEHAVSCADGLGMLVEQAALAFELFTGLEPNTAPVHRWLRQRGAQP